MVEVAWNDVRVEIDSQTIQHFNGSGHLVKLDRTIRVAGSQGRDNVFKHFCVEPLQFGRAAGISPVPTDGYCA